MTATLIDGKAFAAGLRARIAEAVARLAPEGLVPGLAVVLVGDDPASEIYVRNKVRHTLEAGMRSFDHALPATTSEAELLTSSASSMPIRRSTASSCSCRCRRRSTPRR